MSIFSLKNKQTLPVCNISNYAHNLHKWSMASFAFPLYNFLLYEILLHMEDQNIGLSTTK